MASKVRKSAPGQTKKRRDRSDIVFRFKLFGGTFQVRPPRLAYLGKTLAAAAPAILCVVATVDALASLASKPSSNPTETIFRQAMTEIVPSDPKSKAELIFTRLLVGSPSDYGVWDKYVDYLAASGQYPRLQSVLNVLAPDERKGSARFHTRLADLLLTDTAQPEKSLLSAERHLRFAAELDQGPYGVLARRKLALLALNRGDMAAAYKILEPIMTENPVAGAEALWIAWSGNLPFDPNTSARVLDRLERDLRAQRIPSGDNAMAKMRLLIVQNRSEEALEWLSLQKTIDPAIRHAIDVEVAEMQTIASMIRSNQTGVPDWSKLERVLTQKPDDPIWINLAISIWAGPKSLGTEPARQWVQSRLDNDTAGDGMLRQAVIVLANKYNTSGTNAEDSKELRALYRKFLKRFPTDPVALNNLAVLLYKHEPANLEEALTLARRADESAPGQPTIQETIGQILAHMGHVDEALPILEKCLEPMPDEWGLHHLLAQIYDKKGDSQRAEAHKAILANLPKPPDAASFEKLFDPKPSKVDKVP